VSGDLHALGICRLELRRQPTVQGSPLQPRHVGVKGFARQGMAELGAAAVAFDDNPAA
jgi:hypothetical protein